MVGAFLLGYLGLLESNEPASRDFPSEAVSSCHHG